MNLFFKYTGIHMERSPILGSTDEFVKYLENLNVQISRGVIDVGKLELCSADFASLYLSIPHEDLISKIRIMVNYLLSHKKNEFNQGNNWPPVAKRQLQFLKSTPVCHLPDGNMKNLAMIPSVKTKSA